MQNTEYPRTGSSTRNALDVLYSGDAKTIRKVAPIISISYLIQPNISSE
jgi:hypothetical protein